MLRDSIVRNFFNYKLHFSKQIHNDDGNVFMLLQCY